jgi:hypothetical protein
MRPRGALPLVLHQARYDLLAFFRNRQSRFFTLILPILFLVRLRQLLEEAPSSHQPLNARAQTGSGSGIAPRPGPFNSTLQLGATRVAVPAIRDSARGHRRRKRISRAFSHAQVLALPLDGVAVDVARLILGAHDEVHGLVGGKRRRRERGRAGGRRVCRRREVL